MPVAGAHDKKRDMTEMMIELKELSKTFYTGFRRRRVDAVRGVTLEVERGEIFGLIGPNGAGKTTTIKMLTGLIKPTSGSMKIMGYDGFDRRCSRKLGYLPEISYYYESLTAAEILDFYAKLYGISENRARKVDEWLERVNMSYARDKRLGQFSKGMQQRIGLAQALIGNPDLVILDEPQSGLDPIGRRDVSNIIREAQNQGKTIFFSSHILPDVERLCDRVGLIRKGRMEIVGSLRELLSQNQHIEIELLGSPDAEFTDKIGKIDGVKCEVHEAVVNLTLDPTMASKTNDILQLAISSGLAVSRVIERGQDLETLFESFESSPAESADHTDEAQASSASEECRS